MMFIDITYCMNRPSVILDTDFLCCGSVQLTRVRWFMTRITCIYRSISRYLYLGAPHYHRLLDAISTGACAREWRVHLLIFSSQISTQKPHRLKIYHPLVVFCHFGASYVRILPTNFPLRRVVGGCDVI